MHSCSRRGLCGEGLQPVTHTCGAGGSPIIFLFSCSFPSTTTAFPSQTGKWGRAGAPPRKPRVCWASDAPVPAVTISPQMQRPADHPRGTESGSSQSPGLQRGAGPHCCKHPHARTRPRKSFLLERQTERPARCPAPALLTEALPASAPPS